MRANRKCICGAGFYTPPSRLKIGRGKYCSKKCQYENATRPSGLNYNIKVVNKGWIKKGATPPYAGKNLPYPVWNKGLKGIHLNPTTEFKKNDSRLLQSNNHNWKGGITPANTKLRNSYEAREWRKFVFKRDDYTCQDCGERGGKLEANHIKRWAEYPELRFEPSNGETLCRDCHKEKTYARIN